MRLLLDIGNTSTHAALALKRLGRNQKLPTSEWASGKTTAQLKTTNRTK